jgi:hypothetical protein
MRVDEVIGLENIEAGDRFGRLRLDVGSTGTGAGRFQRRSEQSRNR